MTTWEATAVANTKVSLIQNWGLADPTLNIPATGSIALTLDGLAVTTTVKWRIDLAQDRITINDKEEDQATHLTQRITEHLDHVRRLSGQFSYAGVTARSTFSPHMGVSLHAPLFASLTLAAVSAAGQKLTQRGLTALAGLGAGSACQSIPGGFVEWRVGEDRETSFAESIAPADHWPLVDLIAVVSSAGSEIDTLDQGRRLSTTSGLQSSRLLGADARLDNCRKAINTKDFDRLASTVELDSRLVRAVTLTSSPPLFLWAPPTLTIIDRVRAWREAGLAVCYCIAPGPNVHCICRPEDARQIEEQLKSIPGILDVRRAGVGGPAHLLDA